MTHVCPCIVFTYYYSLCISTFFHPHIVHFPVIRLNFAPQCGQICVLATLLITESPLLFTFCFFISFPLYYRNKLPTLLNMYFFIYFPVKKLFSLFPFNNSLLLLSNNMLLLFYYCTNGFCNSYSNTFHTIDIPL